jgi:hypothetical protein
MGAMGAMRELLTLTETNSGANLVLAEGTRFAVSFKAVSGC